MGNSQSQQLVEELKDYLELKKICNPVYGEAMIYQHRSTPHRIAIYFQSFPDEETYERQILRLQEQKHKQSDNAVNMLMIMGSKKRANCATVYVVESGYEYHEHSLLQQIQYRKHT